MKVQATKRGFCGQLYEPGDVFDIQKEQFSENWMEKAKPERSKKPPADAAEPVEDAGDDSGAES